MFAIISPLFGLYILPLQKMGRLIVSYFYARAPYRTNDSVVASHCRNIP